MSKEQFDRSFTVAQVGPGFSLSQSLLALPVPSGRRRRSGAGGLRLVVWALAILMGLATGAAHLFAAQANFPVDALPNERFSPHLTGINNLDAAVALVRDDATRGSADDLPSAADRFVRERFVHGYGTLEPPENWLAWLAGKMWWPIHGSVQPEDILQDHQAICSQQSIVFMAIMRRLGFDVRAIGVTGHYLAAVRVGGEWRVFDANREIPVQSFPLSDLLRGDPKVLTLYPALAATLRDDVAEGRIWIGAVNAKPAPEAELFHRFTALLSDFAWLILLFSGLLLEVTRRIEDRVT